MQPEKLAEVRAWLKKAANDLKAAEIDLAASPPLLEDALFHCQQAAEKAMKGFLTAHDKIFRKTHDLDELAKTCEDLDPSLAPVLDAARDLTVFAWVFHYPGEAEPPSESEVQEFLAVARHVYSAILSRMSKNVGP
jgi:HEPN domain-containing protein